MTLQDRQGRGAERAEIEEAVTGGNVERQIAEAIDVRAPHKGADALQDRREHHEDEDLDAERARLQHQRDREEQPREHRERGLLRAGARPVERQRDRDERYECDQQRERAARREGHDRAVTRS